MLCAIVRLAGEFAFSRGRGRTTGAGETVALGGCDVGASIAGLAASGSFVFETGMIEAGIKAGEAGGAGDDAVGAAAGVVGELFSDCPALALAALTIHFSHKQGML